MAEAMSSDRGERSRSPTREVLPSESTVKAPEGNADNEGGNQPVPVEDQQVAAPDEPKKPEEEQPKAANPAIAAEESAGSTLLKAVVTASKSLEQCAAQLETSVSLLETMRSDSAAEQPHGWSKLLRQCQQGGAGKPSEQPKGNFLGLVEQ